MVLKFKVLLSNVKIHFFRIFQNIPLKYSSLYTNLPNYSKTLISKIHSTKFLLKENVSVR